MQAMFVAKVDGIHVQKVYYRSQFKQKSKKKKKL